MLALPALLASGRGGDNHKNRGRSRRGVQASQAEGQVHVTPRQALPSDRDTWIISPQVRDLVDRLKRREMRRHRPVLFLDVG